MTDIELAQPSVSAVLFENSYNYGQNALFISVEHSRSEHLSELIVEESILPPHCETSERNSDDVAPQSMDENQLQLPEIQLCQRVPAMKGQGQNKKSILSVADKLGGVPEMESEQSASRESSHENEQEAIKENSSHQDAQQPNQPPSTDLFSPPLSCQPNQTTPFASSFVLQNTSSQLSCNLGDEADDHDGINTVTAVNIEFGPNHPSQPQLQISHLNSLVRASNQDEGQSPAYLKELVEVEAPFESKPNSQKMTQPRDMNFGDICSNQGQHVRERSESRSPGTHRALLETPI